MYYCKTDTKFALVSYCKTTGTISAICVHTVFNEITGQLMSQWQLADNKTLYVNIGHVAAQTQRKFRATSRLRTPHTIIICAFNWNTVLH